MQSEYASTLATGRLVQSERIVAPYRTQRPVTRRMPAAQAARTVVLRLHTPFTRCMPGPHASRTGVTMSSSCWMDATGMACVDEATAKAKAMGISLVISRSSQKTGLRLAQDFKPSELDVPLDKGFA